MTLDSIHLDGINISELAREGHTEMLRRSMIDEDKLSIFERYKQGRISADATRLLLGEESDLLCEDVEAFRDAVEDDTSQSVV